MVKRLYFKRYVAFIVFFVVLATSTLIPVQKAKAEVIAVGGAYVVISAIAVALGYEVSTSDMGKEITDAILNTDAGRIAWDNLAPQLKLGVAGSYILANEAKSALSDMSTAISSYFSNTPSISTHYTDAQYSVPVYATAVVGDDSICYDYTIDFGATGIGANCIGNVPYSSGSSKFLDSITVPYPTTFSYLTYSEVSGFETHSSTFTLNSDLILNGCILRMIITNLGIVDFKSVYPDGSVTSKFVASFRSSSIVAWWCDGYYLRNKYISDLVSNKTVPYTSDSAIALAYQSFLDGLTADDDIIVRPVSGVSDYTAPDTIFDTDTATGVIGVATPDDVLVDTPVIDTPTTGTTDLTGVNTGIATGNGILQGILNWLLSFFDKFFALLKSLLMSLFVPSEGFINTSFTGMISSFEDKMDVDTYRSFFTSLQNLGYTDVADITGTFMGKQYTFVSFSSFRDGTVKDRINGWTRGFMFMYLMFYNVNFVYKLIRGISLWDGAKGGGKKE